MRGRGIIRCMMLILIFAISIPSWYGDEAIAAGKQLYVTNAGNNTLSIIDTTKNEIVMTVRVGV